MTLPITTPVFIILRDLVEERVGIRYEVDDMDLFADKVSTRAEELEMTSLLDYYYHLRYDAAGSAEMQELVDALVVNETYFYREADQLTALVDRVLPPMIAKRRPARVWCAACSSGEEPLTLTMMLAERGMLDDVEIVATDISARVLGRARMARYGGRSLRSLPITAERHFDPADEQGFRRVREDLRTRVKLARANLIEPETYPSSGSFDVIACRNVLIYFDEVTVARVVDQLAAALRPGGVLLVSASESLLRFGTALDCEELGGAFFYRKANE